MDRNPVGAGSLITLGGSLSARRAWIEISIRKSTPAKPFVALRKESVDRNSSLAVLSVSSGVSLSARRAWIEIPDGSSGRQEEKQSLSARRAWIEIC